MDWEFQFKLNAFLSASRSVTFVLQKVLSDVPWLCRLVSTTAGTDESGCDNALFPRASEPFPRSKARSPSWAAPFRAAVGPTASSVGRMRYRRNLLVGDIGACCAAHLAKLGSLLADCAHTFPFHACPGRAFTEEGMAALNYQWQDVEAAIELPPGYTDVGDFPAAEKLRILSREVEPLDWVSIERIAAGYLRANGCPASVSGNARNRSGRRHRCGDEAGRPQHWWAPRRISCSHSKAHQRPRFVLDIR